jgi:NAD(P) transhydrogenase subunit alpha
MKIAVPREIAPGEARVGLVPESAVKLKKVGADVVVEKDAGLSAGFRDAEYVAAGASIAPDPRKVYEGADLILKVQPPMNHPSAGVHEASLMRAGAILLGALQPLASLDAMRRLADAKVTAFATEFIPRITRAQKMDTLSSMATIAGYKAVLLAAASLNKFFPLLMTAAGTIKPTNVFVIGAGVAGLQAIATAKRLGAVVEAFDVRPAAKEQILSLGAKVVEVPVDTADAETKGGYAKEMSKEFQDKQNAVTHERCKVNDVVITTAQIFGKRAPVLITEAMVKDMRPGACIVDLAAEQGGNCELTESGRTVVKHHVTIIGETNLPGTMPLHASQMFSRNLAAFVLEFTKEGKFGMNLEDEIIKGAMITHDGKIVNELVRAAAEAAK